LFIFKFFDKSNEQLSVHNRFLKLQKISQRFDEVLGIKLVCIRFVVEPQEFFEKSASIVVRGVVVRGVEKLEVVSFNGHDQNANLF
jgi:hypothetical protein